MYAQHSTVSLYVLQFLESSNKWAAYLWGVCVCVGGCDVSIEEGIFLTLHNFCITLAFNAIFGGENQVAMYMFRIDPPYM